MMVFKFEVIIFPFQSEINKLSPLPGFEPGTPPVASHDDLIFSTNICHGRFSFTFEVLSCFVLSYVLNP